MYGLDINFLSDREIRPVVAARGPRTASGDRRPLYVGLGVAVAALALVGGYWLVLQQQIQRLQAEESTLDAEIAALESQIAALSVIQTQTDLVRAENRAFAEVFEQIIPWSALLQEIRDRTPAGIRLVSMAQTAGITPSSETPEAEPQPPPNGGLQVDGMACSFDDINDFLLVLQQSPLLESETVDITQAVRQSTLLDPAVDGSCPGTPEGVRIALVDFTIVANITNVRASDLLETLDRQGAVGLAARIRALRDSGVTTP